MKPNKHDSYWAGAIYFLILLSMAIWVRDIPNQPDPFHTTLQQISNGIVQLGDPASFATAAIHIAETGHISVADEWVFNLWPPGFVMLEAFILRIFGPQAPVILILQILTVLILSVFLALLYGIIKEHVKSKPVAIALPLLIFSFPVSRVFLLEPKGITLGESFAIGSFLICVLLSIRSLVRGSFSYAILAGLCLATSAYFRSQFEFIMLVLTDWGILMLLFFLIARRCLGIEQSLPKRLIVTVSALLIAYDGYFA